MNFEIKKILFNKIIAAFFALIVVAAFGYFSYSLGTFADWGRNDPNDEAFIQRSMEYIENYNKQSEAVIKSAERIKAESSNIYTKRLSDRIISQRENRRELPLGDNSAVEWFRLALDDTYISILPVLFCVLISAELFCSERRTGVFKFNFTSKNGRMVLYRNKILVLMIFSACTAVVYTAVQVAAVMPKYGISYINAPIQIESTYTNCAYNIGFLQFVFAVAGTRILGCWFVCLLTVCLALIFGNLIASAAVSGGACAILFLLHDRTLKQHGAAQVAMSKYFLHHTLQKFSPICLINPNGYFVSSDYVNVFYFPVTELFFNVAVTVAVTAALAVFGGYLFSRKRRRIP